MSARWNWFSTDFALQQQIVWRNGARSLENQLLKLALTMVAAAAMEKSPVAYLDSLDVLVNHEKKVVCNGGSARDLTCLYMRPYRHAHRKIRTYMHKHKYTRTYIHKPAITMTHSYPHVHAACKPATWNGFQCMGTCYLRTCSGFSCIETRYIRTCTSHMYW